METVAPHAGAWIETKNQPYEAPFFEVAPHAGAWIETIVCTLITILPLMSHPTRVRGLKLDKSGDTGNEAIVAPHAGAWIETSGHA